MGSTHEFNCDSPAQMCFTDRAADENRPPQVSRCVIAAAALWRACICRRSVLLPGRFLPAAMPKPGFGGTGLGHGRCDCFGCRRCGGLHNRLGIGDLLDLTGGLGDAGFATGLAPGRFLPAAIPNPWPLPHRPRWSPLRPEPRQPGLGNRGHSGGVPRRQFGRTRLLDAAFHAEALGCGLFLPQGPRSRSLREQRRQAWRRRVS